jgi:hypothetical protein
MIAFDTTARSALFIPGSPLCKAGSTTPIKHGKERLSALVDRVAKSRDTILIPTPVLSELLVCLSPEKIGDLLTELNASVWFHVESFDSVAAVELAVRTSKAIAAGDKREGLADAPWTKVKFDRQIVAIAIANGASEIISDDPHIKAVGERWGIKVTSVDDLPIPAEFIPPPLLAALEKATDEKEEDPLALVADDRGTGAGHPEDRPSAETAEGSAVEGKGDNARKQR